MALTESPTSVWVLPDDSAPLCHVVEEYNRLRGPVEVLYTLYPPEGRRGYGVELRLPSRDRGYPMSIKVIHPGLALDLVRSRAREVIVLELDLAAMYALLSKLFRPRRRVVALIEGDVRMLGSTGSVGWKMAFRRLVARFVDAFAANNTHAVRYLTEDLGAPPGRVVHGWWLAGFPEGLPSQLPAVTARPGDQGPTFTSIGQLIPRKGHAALIRAASRFRDEHGPCQVWILGEGPDRAALEQLVRELDMEAHVVLLGDVNRAGVHGALQCTDLFVFPTFSDLVGRALVEALSTGVPVVVSRHSGAIGTLLTHDENCVVVDPDDPDELYRGLEVAADPAHLSRLREGAQRVAPTVSVPAAARAIARAVDS